MDAAPLPSGWEARNTDDGRTFFIDHNTQQTTWDDPRQVGAPPLPPPAQPVPPVSVAGGGVAWGGVAAATTSFPEFTPNLTPTFSGGVSGGSKWDSWGEQLSISSEAEAFGPDASSAGSVPPNEPDAPECTACGIKFTQTIRRHHCRSCGRCVCQYCSPKTVEMASLQLKGEQRCCVACYEYLSKGRSSSLERVFSLLTRGEEEHTRQLATRELLEFCAVATESLPEKVVEKVVDECSTGGQLALTALTAVSKMAGRREAKQALVDRGCLRAVVNLARTSSDEVKMQAIHALATLSDGDISCQNAVRDADGLSVLLPMLSSDYPEHVEVACTAMRKLCSGCRANANEMNQQGGTGFLMDLLSSASSEVREQACAALMPLVQDNNDAQGRILSAGGVEKFLNSVHDPKMQAFSLEMLSALSSGQNSASFCDHFVRGVGIPSILQLLLNNSDAGVLSTALSILTQVVNSNGDVGDAMHEANYLAALPKLMQHPSSSIRSHATFLVKMLSFSQAHTHAPVDIFTACISLLVGISDVSGDTSSLEAKVLAAESLRNFSRWPHNAPACWETLGTFRHMLRQLVELVQTPTRDGQMESAVSAMLACLTSHQDQISTNHLAMLHEAGIHTALISALSSPHLAVQKGAASTLANVMSHDTLGHTLRMEVFNFGGVPLLKTLLAKDDEELKQAVVYALASLASEDQVADQIDLQPFIHLLKSSDAMMQPATMAIVDKITRNSDFKQQQLMDADTLPVIVNMMNSPDPETQRRAIKQVCSFATDSQNWRTIREYNGLPKLVEMLSSPDPTVLHDASECISNMVLDAENARALLACGGHMALIPLLSRQSVDIQRHAAAAIAAMARAGGLPYVAAIVEARGVEPLVQLLRSGTVSGERDAQTLAHDALQALAVLSQDPRAATHMGSTCLDTLFELAEKYDEGVQQQAIYLLLNLASCDPQMRNKMVATVRVGVMLRFMASEHEEAQEIGVKALAAALGDGKNGTKAVVRLMSEPEFMATLMGTFTASGKTVREFASIIVTNLLSTKEFRTKFVAEGGFGALNGLVSLNKDSQHKTRNGVAAMEILMADGDLDLELQRDSNERQLIEQFIDQLCGFQETGGGANVEKVIGILARLSSQDSCVDGLACKPEALRTLLHQLAAGITKDALKENILKIVTNSCRDEDCAIMVARLGGYKSVCAAVKLANRGQSSAKVQIRRLGLSGLVAIAQHQKCRLTMAQEETLPLLVDVLANHADDKALRLSATKCIVELSSHTTIAEKLVEEGGLEQILSLLRDLTCTDAGSGSQVERGQLAEDDRLELVEAVASCIAGFSVCADAVDSICESEDLLEATTSALKHMQGMVALLDGEPNVQLSICTALAHFAIDDICREALCQAAGVDSLVKLLQTEDTQVRVSAGRVLVRITSAEAGRAAVLRSSVMASGGDSVRERAGVAVTSLVSMLSQMDEPSVKTASELLCFLAMSDQGRRAIGAAEGIPSLIHVMRNFDSEEMSMNILSCLHHLAYLRANRVTLRDPDFLSVLEGIESSGDELMIPLVKRLRQTIGGSFYANDQGADRVLEPLPLERAQPRDASEPPPTSYQPTPPAPYGAPASAFSMHKPPQHPSHSLPVQPPPQPQPAVQPPVQHQPPYGSQPLSVAGPPFAQPSSIAPPAANSQPAYQPRPVQQPAPYGPSAGFQGAMRSTPSLVPPTSTGALSASSSSASGHCATTHNCHLFTQRPTRTRPAPELLRCLSVSSHRASPAAQVPRRQPQIAHTVRDGASGAPVFIWC